MCENKLLRDELAKSKEAIEILKTTKTDGCLSEKQCKQLEQEITVVRQLYSIDLDNFAELCEDNTVIMPSFLDQLTNGMKSGIKIRKFYKDTLCLQRQQSQILNADCGTQI